MQTNPNRSNNNRPYSTNCTCLATLTTMPTMATIDRPCPTSLAISVVMTAFISSLPKCHNKFVVATDPNTINSNTETICNHRPLTASSATTPNYNSSANRMAITVCNQLLNKLLDDLLIYFNGIFNSRLFRKEQQAFALVTSTWTVESASSCCSSSGGCLVLVTTAPVERCSCSSRWTTALSPARPLSQVSLLIRLNSFSW